MTFTNQSHSEETEEHQESKHESEYTEDGAESVLEGSNHLFHLTPVSVEEEEEEEE